jgi:hypothetical protein
MTPLRKVFCIIFLSVISNIGYPLPPGPFHDAVFNRNIKTVQLYKEGWEFSYPIFDMKSEAPLLLSFDDLSAEPQGLDYVIVFCDADWMPSRISYSEYMDGFYQNPLSQYTSSFNTSLFYTHYTLQIPNEDVKLKLPGNYIVLVYSDDEDKPLFVKRFVVVDQQVEIISQIRRPTMPKYQNAFQEIDFTIVHSDYAIDNPYETVKVSIVKNNQWNFSIDNLKPLFIRNGELVYDYEDKNLFPGGNEYRSFDLKSLKYQSANIQSIAFVNNSWQVVLKPDSPRDRVSYMYNEDFDGKYLIQNKQGLDASNDAEYVHVKFTFPMDAPLADGDIYVFGGFSDFNCSDDYKMVYSLEHKAYEYDLLVKQGYYNYQYVYVPKNTSKIDERYFEGSFYETENNYIFYVYYRPFGCRYDKLIGVKIANTLKSSF